ncbi:MAG: adrenomedullin/calcitonin family protein [Tabrizicola sp.]|nr:adrenomedullin/calcitonin family protein [Tabrizicola sp.]
MTLTLLDFPRFPRRRMVWTPEAPGAAPGQEALQTAPDPKPLSEEDRAYLDHRFVRDWMVENPEALQSESGAMMLRALYPARF